MARIVFAAGRRLFALDAATCVPRWGYTYVASDPERFPSTRGLALYDGKIFKGTSDGHLIALDAADGKLLWEAIVDDSNLGYCVSGAPMAVAGKVIVGECGGDNGIKGHVHAFDAVSGKPLWTFDAIPTGDQPGADTWGGGTEHYSDERGHPRLRMRHGHVAIGQAERDAWLAQMKRALREAPDLDPAIEQKMVDYFEMASTHMINVG